MDFVLNFVRDRGFSFISASESPSSVTDMHEIFYVCTSLTGTISVPCTEYSGYLIENTNAIVVKYHYTDCGH